jgi:hypothetical protein
MSKDTSRETVSTCQHIHKLLITRNADEHPIRKTALINRGIDSQPAFCAMWCHLALPACTCTCTADMGTLINVMT